ncbi:integrase catalytic domain-containing protein [Trichonephila clavipes]|nr:integrase catalytic domain-containing protein [Trichonephila clavipes]
MVHNSLKKGKLSSEETSLSPVKECEYSKELKTDIDQAETKLIRMVQEQVFLAEIKSLQSKGVVSPNSKLRNLNPFIDSDGLLRVGGRLSNSDLPYVCRVAWLSILHHNTVELNNNKHLLTLD